MQPPVQSGLHGHPHKHGYAPSRARVWLLGSDRGFTSTSGPFLPSDPCSTLPNRPLTLSLRVREGTEEGTCVGLVHEMALRLYLYTACARCCNLSFILHKGGECIHLYQQAETEHQTAAYQKADAYVPQSQSSLSALKAVGLEPRPQTDAACACVPSLHPTQAPPSGGYYITAQRQAGRNPEVPKWKQVPQCHAFFRSATWSGKFTPVLNASSPRKSSQIRPSLLRIPVVIFIRLLSPDPLPRDSGPLSLAVAFWAPVMHTPPSITFSHANSDERGAKPTAYRLVVSPE